MRYFFSLIVFSVILFAGQVLAQDDSRQKEQVLSARKTADESDENRKHCESLGFRASAGDNRCFSLYPSDLMIWGKGFSDGLAKVTVGGKSGFINTAGKLVIAAKFSDVGKFNEGLAPFENRDGKWGFIDTQGNEAIKPRFDWALSFSDGLAAVQVGDKWGFIDRNGQILVEPKFDTVSGFSEGLAFVIWDEVSELSGIRSERTRSGFIDTKGRIVLGGTFDSIHRNFDDGIALVSSEVECEFGSCSETFAINANGDRLWTLDSWYISRFSDDAIVVASGKDAEGHDVYIAIGRDGKPLFLNAFSRIGEFSEGLAPARKNWAGKYGFIGKDGKYVIPEKYGWARSFSEGLAAVEVDSKWGYIDASGKTVVDARFDFADKFQEGFALVAPSGKDKFKTGYIDRAGNYIWKPTK